MNRIIKILGFLFFFLLIGWAILQRFFEPLELVGYDIALRLRSRLNPVNTHDLPVVFLPIDDATLRSKEFRQFPIPRDKYAVVLDALREWGAKQVVFDILFLEPSMHTSGFGRTYTNPDGVFLSSINRFEVSGGDVLLPYGFTIDVVGRKRILPLYYPFAQVIRERNKLKSGFVNTKEDIDGKMRFLIVREKDENHLLYRYHMALVNVLNYLGVRQQDILDKPNAINFVIMQGKRRIKVQQIPLTFSNRLYLDYPGRWKDCFNKVSFGSVYHYWLGWQKIRKGEIKENSKEGKKILQEIEVLKRLIKGKACIIGLTASGTTDLRPTPLETSSPMVGVYGVVFSQVWHGRYIKRMPSWFSVVVFLLFLLGAKLFSRSLSKLWIMYLSLVSIWIIFALILFVYKGWWFDYLSPVLGSVIFVMASSVDLYLEILREREKVEHEMRLAADIQSHMLPKHLPDVEPLSVEVFFSPAVFVAGDFYDIWGNGREGRLRVLVGDVSGKGVSAALYVAQVITVERVLRSRFESRKLGEFLEEINRFLSRFKISGVYATACMLEMTSDKLIISDAGHLSVWIYRSRGKCIDEVKLAIGTPLGVDRWAEYGSIELDWEGGDVVIIFSDGLTEARVGDKFVKEEDIKRWVLEHIDEPNCRIEEFVSAFYGGKPQSDDISFLLVRNKVSGGSKGGDPKDR